MDKQSEAQFILELCKIKTYRKETILELMEQPLDYPYILGHLLFNRVGGAAYTVLQKCNLLGKLNREFRNVLKTIYDSNCEKANSFLCDLEQMRQMLQDADLKYAVLKGGYLVYLYEKGIRTSNDIDILINQEDITVLSNILKQNNYRQGNIRSGVFMPADRLEILTSRMNRGETVPFIKEIGLPQMRSSEIDINFSLDFKAKQEQSVIPDMLSRTKSLIQTEKGMLDTLDKADFLIQLCTHLFKEATTINWVRMGRDISLYKYMDIYLFVLTFLDDRLARDLTDRIKAYNLEEECYYAFQYTKELFGMDCHEFNLVIEEIKPMSTAFLSQVISPADGKIYIFDLPYVQWVFCSSRGGHLHEITVTET